MDDKKHPPSHPHTKDKKRKKNEDICNVSKSKAKQNKTTETNKKETTTNR
jgi:hypothetical protein